MLLGRKSKQDSKVKWAVVLDRVPNEISRSRTIHKLSKAFSLSIDEAGELVDNTPLILLDELTHEVAAKVKEQFARGHVGCFLTSDTLTKRKCFRAVWPVTPKISTLVGEEEAKEEPTPSFTAQSEQVQNQKIEQKINDVLQRSREESIPVAPTKEPSKQRFNLPKTDGDAKPKSQHKLDSLTAELRKENETLKSRVERADREAKILEQKQSAKQAAETQKDRARYEGERDSYASKVHKLERELNARAEEVGKFEMERERFDRDVSAKKEEVVALASKVEILGKQVHDTQVLLDKHKADRLKIDESLKVKSNENASLIAKVRELERNIKQRDVTLENEVVEEARQSVEVVKRQLDHFRAEYDRAQSLLRNAQAESKQLQVEATEVQEALRTTRVETAHYHSEWTEAQKNLSQIRSENEDLKRSLVEVQTISAQHRESLDQKKSELAERIQRHGTELEEWKRKANDWSSSYTQVIKENEFLRTRQGEELESLRTRNQELSGQLEQAQKQIRGFANQLEQQEIIQKRMKATNELNEHEAKLKTLVRKQQKLEKEIHEKEEELKVSLGDQEVMEREIVKTKQVQKYLLEQSKIKDRQRPGRSKGTGKGVVSLESPESESSDSNE
jgi:golgin subfamily A member 4